MDIIGFADIVATEGLQQSRVFFQSRRSLQNHVEFIYKFSQGLRMRQTDLMEDGVASSSRTLSRMTAVIRKVCIRAVKKLRHLGQMKVGGRHCFVLIDESKFSHKRKYNRGRFGAAWRRNKKWVLGILEVEQERRKPILKVAGYDHHTVCHKRNFVDPVTRAHTQHLERAWKTYKMDIWHHRGNRTTKLLKEHLKVIEWEYWLARNHPSHILGRLIHDIRKYNLHECG
ncbi:Patatin-like protein 4 [Labeo rohita]|uniref:Patatin-like protein 4 n=1 Tax=Labeo rohita TaxID=84645 RepID=A0ABQ8L0M2_LABRO|nr:Patatin-like protein 4 [Labeo rohita]